MTQPKFRQKKSMDQVFLNDISIALDIVEAAEVESTDRVVEIGPGLGVLTGFLQQKADKLYIIEKDIQLCRLLKSKFEQHDNMHIVNTDALFFPYNKIPAKFKLISNFPYSISTPLLFALLEHKKSISSMVIMLQKEVAERITAAPGKKAYGRLSIAAQLYCSVKLLFQVPKEAFNPVPKVDSAVIRLDILENLAVDVKDTDLFFKIVHTAFRQRRKTLRNNFKTFPCSADIVLNMFQKCNIDPSRRAETLSIEEFASMSNYLKL